MSTQAQINMAAGLKLIGWKIHDMESHRKFVKVFEWRTDHRNRRKKRWGWINADGHVLTSNSANRQNATRNEFIEGLARQWYLKYGSQS